MDDRGRERRDAADSRRCWLARALAAVAAPSRRRGAERADLKLTKVSHAPATATAGNSFRLTTTVRNAGGRRAKATTLVAYLSTHARRGPRDILLTGERKVDALRRDEADEADQALHPARPRCPRAPTS